MAENRNDVLKINVESWLTPILSKLSLEEYSLEVQGTSEKGDGYMGDILFVEVIEKPLGGKEGRKFNWVLKCGKKSEKLREALPVRDVFKNEMEMYDHVFPELIKFQKSKNVEDYFNSVPKCYGTVLLDDMEIIVLENLKKKGYDLWDRMRPMPRTHLEMVLKQYGKWHATSLALQNQRPDEFRKLTNEIRNISDLFFERGISNSLLTNAVDKIHSIIEGHFDSKTLGKWLKLKEFVDQLEKKTHDNYANDVKVILHGDCWNNNFLFKFEDDINAPSEVSILDWQIAEIEPPVYDLSYFLFACISKEDLENFDELLEVYYDSFATHLENLGSDPDKVYPLEQLKSDWKKYSKYGLLMISVVLKFALSQGDEITDLAEDAESGKKFGELSQKPLKDETLLRERFVPIVEHVVERGII